MKTILPLYHYPTSVVFVDDHKNFLNAMKLSMGAKYHCAVFEDPSKAIDHINHNSKKELREFNEKLTLIGDSEDYVNNTLNVSTTKIQNDQRFTEISVAVIDFDMPKINGLRLCEAIKSKNIKKILLTGHIGAAEAVEAFNDGLIDFYINKSDPDLHQKVDKAIEKLQYKYFIDISSNIKIQAIDVSRPIFSDETFFNYLNQLIKKHRVSEYYYATNPSRYMLTKEDGQLAVLLVYTRKELNEQIRIIKEEAGPKWLIESLGSGRYVPYFKTIDGFYDSGVFDPDETIYLADKIEGKETFYCALIENDTSAIKKIMLPDDIIYH